MGNRRRIAIAAALMLVFLGLFAWLVLRQREPSYNGKTLSEWLEVAYRSYTIDGPSGDPVVAIRAIGTNAVPSLLSMLRAHDSQTALKLKTWLNDQRFIRKKFYFDSEKKFLGYIGFQALGPLGSSAVPELTVMLKDKDADTCGAAVGCLGEIGPAAAPAVPDLLKLLNATNQPEQYDIARTLAQIHARSDIAVPALISALTDPQTSTYSYSQMIEALGEFGTNARPGIPLLQSFLTKKNPEVRNAATNALEKIDSTVLSASSVK